jgi:hypothetical protein
MQFLYILLITTLKNDNDLLNIFDPEKYFALKPSELINVVKSATKRKDLNK